MSIWDEFTVLIFIAGKGLSIWHEFTVLIFIAVKGLSIWHEFTVLIFIAGKGLSVWDEFTHQEGNIHNNDTGDVACDSYHKWQQDIHCLQELGVSHL